MYTSQQSIYVVVAHAMQSTSDFVKRVKGHWTDIDAVEVFLFVDAHNLPFLHCTHARDRSKDPQSVQFMELTIAHDNQLNYNGFAIIHVVMHSLSSDDEWMNEWMNMAVS
jgi:hypothetical protein